MAEVADLLHQWRALCATFLREAEAPDTLESDAVAGAAYCGMIRIEDELKRVMLSDPAAMMGVLDIALFHARQRANGRELAPPWDLVDAVARGLRPVLLALAPVLGVLA